MPTYPIKTNVTQDRGPIDSAIKRSETVTASGAETYPELLVLGRITASEKLTKYRSDAGDGSETPIAIMAIENVFAGAGDVVVDVHVAGKFDAGTITKDEGGSLTQAEIDTLHRASIFVSSSTDLSEFA